MTEDMRRPDAVRAVAVVVALAGVVYRLHQFGRFGFWNDEAWVAISTRVSDPSQFLLALSSSPLAWTLALRPLALLPDPETSLRLLPLAFGLATMWLAWRLGCRLAGDPLGGLCALALVAFDPVSIQYAKQLKQYSAEAFVTLATLLVACDVDHDGRGRRPRRGMGVGGGGV
jgi:predicted membrane-bound mannosyltransferase